MTIRRAFLIGLATGCRSQAGLAAISLTPAGPGRIDRLLHRIGGRTGTVLQVVGESVADKLPVTPPRTAPPALYVRLGLGALTAAVLASRCGESLAPAALVGLLGCAASTYAGVPARGALAARFGSDLPGALSEDALALGLAFVAVRLP
ncbi:DUF4126 domain-containing protein [uncultured Jatrophihabitans sp.]|uniref:DUF4126 domain-containing protein n=1 Tax=uncultured Jatrophihabitans sp. TaxID=1610747 RepID=UPI0035CBB492